MKDLTFLIKTFERPDCLLRCLQSVYGFFSDARVVVVDDSFQPYAKVLLAREFAAKAIHVHEMSPDVGVSAGRNHGVAAIGTPYLVLIDDDHELRPDSDILGMREALLDGNWDIVAGTYVHYDRQNRPFTWSWEGALARIDTVLICRPLADRGKRVSPCDIVNNFFVARTDAVKSIGGWDPELKTLEHVDFFLRAQQAGLRVAHLGGTYIDHRIVRGPHYHQFRIGREQQFRDRWMRKHGISHFVTFEGKVHCIPELWAGNRRSLAQ